MAVLIRPEQPGDAAQLHENVCSANTLAEVEERITANLRTMRVGDQVHLVAEVDGVIAAAEGLIRNARGGQQIARWSATTPGPMLAVPDLVPAAGIEYNEGDVALTPPYQCP